MVSVKARGDENEFRGILLHYRFEYFGEDSKVIFVSQHRGAGDVNRVPKPFFVPEFF